MSYRVLDEFEAGSTAWLPTRQFAQYLRRRSTASEDVLWQALRGRRLHGFKFRRQHPIGRWIVDFYCPAAGLAVELDGASHLGRERADAYRDRQLGERGVTVLRIAAYRVFRDLDGVRHSISDALNDRWALVRRWKIPGHCRKDMTPYS